MESYQFGILYYTYTDFTFQSVSKFHILQIVSESNRDSVGPSPIVS